MNAVVILAALALSQAEGAASNASAECGPGMKSAVVFIECARAATRKYHDQAAASLDGYRPVGRDFPAMGEHWIRIGLVFDGQFDADRPEVLTYLTVGGTPQLLGVAYALPLLPGEPVPDWPAGKAAWHDHVRTIEDETVQPHHHSSDSARNGARLAMLHAWIWSSNPEGTFAADNWAIPYLRAGIAPPESADSAAAKALALATGGAEYFSLSIEAALPGTTGRPAIQAAFARARADVEAVLGERTTARATDSEVSRLRHVWSVLWTTIDASVGADTRRQLQHLAIR